MNSFRYTTGPEILSKLSTYSNDIIMKYTRSIDDVPVSM